MSAIARLGELLTADEATRIAADLRLRRRPNLAASKAHGAHRPEVKAVLRELVISDADVPRVVAALEGIASVPRVPRPDIVWTNPRDVPGAEGRTTRSAIDMINRAESAIYAATYSAGRWSPHLQALKHATDRGVGVTIVVDTYSQSETAAMIAGVLPAARVWTLDRPEDDSYAIQHAKLIAIDDREALVTSANFSVAGAESSLECGLLSADAVIATGLRTRIDQLHQHGVLVEL